MPLHDWTDDRGWDGVHHYWISDLARRLMPRLPDGYRAFVGSVPALTVDAGEGRPDVRVRGWTPPPAPARAAAAVTAPDRETVATFRLDPFKAVHIDFHGRLVAAVELVSPRNKDRPASRDRYANRCIGYLRQGVHLMLVDLLPRPADFSFADVVAADIGLDLPPCPAPFAVSLRVGEPVPDGTLVASWERRLRPGDPLPSLPLHLNIDEAVTVDLEATYSQAAASAYLP